MPNMIGITLNNRYKITEHLGRGGFAQTYIANDLHKPNYSRCVIKKLDISGQIHNVTKAQAQEIKKNSELWFNREAEALEKLGKHDQIPTLLAYFPDGDQHFYLVMEYIDGKILSQEIEELETSGDRQAYVMAMLQDLLPVLDFVHQQGVIHRDIKPSNLIRRRDGKIVVIDFGAVKEIGWKNLESQNKDNISTIALGTDGYAPDEQIAHNAKPASDIYALGMTCIQVLTGEHPKNLDRDPITSEVIWRDLYRDLYHETNAPNVSDELVDLIDQMVRSHFPMRYQNISAVMRDLTQIKLPVAPINQADEINQSAVTVPLKPMVLDPTQLIKPLAATELIRPQTLESVQPVKSIKQQSLPILVAAGGIALVAIGSAFWYVTHVTRSSTLVCGQDYSNEVFKNSLDLNKGDRLSNLRKANIKILEQANKYVFSTGTEIELLIGLDAPLFFSEVPAKPEVKAVKGWKLKAIKDSSGQVTKINVRMLSQILGKYDKPELNLNHPECRLVTLIVEDPATNLQTELRQVDELLFAQYAVNAILSDRFKPVGI